MGTRALETGCKEREVSLAIRGPVGVPVRAGASVLRTAQVAYQRPPGLECELQLPTAPQTSGASVPVLR